MAVVNSLNLSIESEMVYLATPLGGGYAEPAEVTGGNCGLLSGTAMALGLFFWRRRRSEGATELSLDDRKKITKFVNLWLAKFKIEAGARSCPEIVGSMAYMGPEHRSKCWHLGQNIIELFLNFLREQELI